MKENKIYKAIMIELSKDRYVGLDIEQLSKKLSKKVSKTLLPKQRREVYDATTKEWERCKAISARCGIKSNLVSVILTLMLEDTTLIESKKDGRFYLYRRKK